MKKKPAKKAPAPKKKKLLPIYDPIEMVGVDSSTIWSLGWKNEVLRVQFKDRKTGKPGEVYRYRFVPERIYNDILNADEANLDRGLEIGDKKRQSVGSLFHDLIRNHPEKYPYEKEEK